MQKLNAKLSPGDPETTASYVSPIIIHPNHMYRIFAVREVTILLNLP